MPEAGSGSVQVLTVDPDLVRDLDPVRAREAAQRLYARAFDIPRGRWTPKLASLEGTRPIGLLVLEGLLIREATVDDHPSIELLGPGDLIRAWDDGENEELLPRTIDWTALIATRVAIIDHAFAVRAAQLPEVFAGLLERSVRLSHRTLAGMVGARRPSVTTALGQLMARGEIERREDGEWILLGEPPAAKPSARSAQHNGSVRFQRA